MREPIWTQKNGVRIFVADMHDNHIRNVIAQVEGLVEACHCGDLGCFRKRAEAFRPGIGALIDEEKRRRIWRFAPEPAPCEHKPVRTSLDDSPKAVYPPDISPLATASAGVEVTRCPLCNNWTVETATIVTMFSQRAESKRVRCRSCGLQLEGSHAVENWNSLYRMARRVA